MATPVLCVLAFFAFSVIFLGLWMLIMYRSKSGHKNEAIHLLEQWKKYTYNEAKRKQIEQQLTQVLPAEVRSFDFGSGRYTRIHATEESDLHFNSCAELLAYIKSIKPEDYRLP